MNSLDAIHSFEKLLYEQIGVELKLTYGGILWDSVIEQFDDDGMIDRAMHMDQVAGIAANFQDLSNADFFGLYNGDIQIVGK